MEILMELNLMINKQLILEIVSPIHNILSSNVLFFAPIIAMTSMRKVLLESFIKAQQPYTCQLNF